MIRSYARNKLGRDIGVGDIHGHFELLSRQLERIGFDPRVDRLFSVGDLVDRGPQCDAALEWLSRTWFHAVRGNHDDYVVRFDTCDVENWVYNGGAWFAGLAWDLQREFATQFAELPIAIEVETLLGVVGIVHAEVAFDDWDRLSFSLFSPESPKQDKLVKNTCMWSRRRIELREDHEVKGVHAVVVGHTPVDVPTKLGNVWYIDTRGWQPNKGGYFTLMDLNTLEVL